MKTKKITKKLQLNKTTLSNLDQKDMNAALGGASAMVSHCPGDDNCHSSPWVCYTQYGYPDNACTPTYATCITHCGGYTCYWKLCPDR